MNCIQRLSLLGLALSLSACSVLEGDKIDYKSASQAPSLAVPPDLTQLSRENRYSIPGGAVTASSFQLGQQQAQAQGVPVALATLGNGQKKLIFLRPGDEARYVGRL